jgi:hypothetical protein
MPTSFDSLSGRELQTLAQQVMRLLPSKLLGGLAEGLEVARGIIPGMQVSISSSPDDHLRVIPTGEIEWEAIGICVAKACPIFYEAGIRTWVSAGEETFSICLGFVPAELGWIRDIDSAGAAITTVIDRLKKALPNDPVIPT